MAANAAEIARENLPESRYELPIVFCCFKRINYREKDLCRITVIFWTSRYSRQADPKWWKLSSPLSSQEKARIRGRMGHFLPGKEEDIMYAYR